MHPRPGDVGGTLGSGFAGFVIRHGTSVTKPAKQTIAHTFIWVEKVKDCDDGSEDWLCHEAFGSKDLETGMSGIRVCIRNTNTEPVETLRIARTPAEVATILAVSQWCVDTNAGYDWSEIGRIACYFGDKKFHLPLNGLGEYLIEHSDPYKRICCNHVALCVAAARPDIETTYPPERIWPDRQFEDLRPYAVA